MRKPYIAGNWKMNMTPSEGAKYAAELRKAVEDSKADVKVMVAPPFVTIPAVVEALKGSSIIVAAQNMANHTSGAYTGEVAPAMLKDLGVNTVILGHSERRSYYGESDEFINSKVLLALSEGMDVVLCVGETLEEREGGKLEEVLSRQVTVGLKGVEPQLQGTQIVRMHTSALLLSLSIQMILQKISLFSMVVLLKLTMSRR